MRAAWTPERREAARLRRIEYLRGHRERGSSPRVRHGQADPGPMPGPGAIEAPAAAPTYRVVFLDYDRNRPRETTLTYLPQVWRRLERLLAGGMTERVWRRVPCDPMKWDACYLEGPPKPYRFPSGKTQP